MSIISVYKTPSGKIAMKISKNGEKYSWIGEYGAGSGHSKATIIEIVKSEKKYHKGMKHAEGIDFLTVETPRKTNPVREATRSEKIEGAMRLFERFRLEEPRFVDEVEAPACDVAMLIGDCDGILYTTKRNGKIEKYIHEFAKKSRPLLAASWDGKQLFILGGKYNFTQDGITDF